MSNPNGLIEKRTAVGILLMVSGVLCMIGLDVCVRWLLQTYTVAQSVFLRCGFSVLIIFGISAVQGDLQAFRTQRPGWHVLRSCLMAGSMFAFFVALKHIPLAEVMALAFAAPLIVTALSKPMLGEQVGPWRWSAVIFGFIGVLVVLRPGTNVIHPAAFLALGGAALYAVIALSARMLAATESTPALSLFLFPAPLLIGAAVSPGVWIPPNAVDWFLFFLCGLFGGLAFIMMNAAFRRAQASLLVPFEYTGLIWAAIAGYLIWDEVPGLYTWLGAAIIVTSGLFILYRETTLGRAAVGSDFPLQDVVACQTEEPQ